MVTLQNADKALKSFYLDAISDSLNYKVNPFLAQVQQTSTNIVGKDIKKLVRLGFNGGISAGSETGDLPAATDSTTLIMTAQLKNLYGTFEISDKALRASATDDGAFVNLLNEEMQGLVRSANFNFGRMLFGDGTGKVAVLESVGTKNVITLDDVSSLAEGMHIDFYTPAGVAIDMFTNVPITAVDRGAKTIKISSSTTITSQLVEIGSYVYLHNSKGYELTGIGSLFSDSTTVYGVNKHATTFMQPYKNDEVGAISAGAIQKAIDTIEEQSGAKTNFIVCSWGVRRALVEWYRERNIELPTMEINGFKALSFDGIPVLTDRFCPEGTMYLLNTEDFKLYQLCDWQWLEGEDGKILKQVPGKPVYTATLVKYAELLCERPCGQGRLSGITEA